LKLGTVLIGNQTKYGVFVGSIFHSANATISEKFPTLQSLIAANSKGLELIDNFFNGPQFNISDIKYLPPIPNSNKLICVGLNYDKIYPVEGENPPKPQNIMLFGKEQSSIVAHNQDLGVPSGKAALSFDYEGEISVIIGKKGQNITPSDAHEHIFGYSVFNDGSVREWQKHSIYAGKNFEKSSSWGPYIITKNEIKDHKKLRLTTFLNSKLVQDTTADKMIFSIEEQIAYASTLFTLLPGDLIATGSPDGTGGSQVPKRHLVSGDTLEVTVSGVATLVNNVI
jgi:2-keto-4-pentenoate hydratase/2-oxohepta-3-ene-1,7-dioic acid hydratase in catechol pathway